MPFDNGFGMTPRMGIIIWNIIWNWPRGPSRVGWMCIWIFIIVILGLVSFVFFSSLFFLQCYGEEGEGENGGLRSVMILHCLIIIIIHLLRKKKEEED